MNSSPIRIQLFGRPELHAGGQPVALSPMQWALVAFLHGGATRGATRAETIAFLWADARHAPARRRLSQLLYEVEARAGGLFLKPGNALRPNHECVATDLEDFYDSVRSEGLGEAARLLARGFLNRLPDIPTPEYDRWIERRDASLRAELRTRATRRWTKAEDEALWNQKTRDAADALLYLDPASEAALRKSMWAQAMSGTPLEAIATLESFVETNGFGGPHDLDEATRTLYERVRALARHRKGSQIERSRPSRADPTLFGREQELARLRPLLAGPIAEGITVVAVEGEAGLGKTRLVKECLEPSMLQGRLILQTQLAELERDIPLNALIEPMNTQDIVRPIIALEDPWRSVILNLLPDFADVVGAPIELPYVEPTSLQRRLLESVRLLVDALVSEQPVLLFIDDFHWADDSSLAALEYLRRRWSVGSLILVVAFRPECVTSNSTLSSFLETATVRRVKLGPIAPVAQKQLIKEAAGGEVPDSVVDDLRELGSGNPLFLIELARQWSEGELTLPSTSVESIQLPGSIRQLFERRLHGLGESAARVLEALSVLAKRVPMSVIREVSGLGHSEVADGLEALDRSGLLRWNPSGVALWHGLVRQATLGRTAEARRRWLHAQVATYLRDLGDDGLADEIAVHFDRARLSDEAFRYSLVAADQAEALGALPEVLMMLKVCEKNATDEQRVSIQVRQVRAHHLQCDHRTALAIGDALPADELSPSEHLAIRALIWDCKAHLQLEAPARLFRENVLIREAARAEGAWETRAIALASALHHGQRTGAVDIRALLCEIEECAGSGDPRAESIAHRISVWRRALGDVATSRWHAQEAVRIAQASGYRDLLPRAFNVLLVIMSVDGDLGSPEGERLQRDALRSAKDSGDLLGHLRLLSNIGAFYLDIGELERAKNLLDEALIVRLSANVEPEGARCLVNQGELNLEKGDPERAQGYFEAALPAQCGSEWMGWETALAGAGLCRIARGDIAGAIALHGRLDRGPEPPVRFPVDATLPARFRSRMARLQTNDAAGDRILADEELRLDEVNRPGYLKLRWERARYGARTDQFDWQELASEGLALSTQLGLRRRGQQFATLLAT